MASLEYDGEANAFYLKVGKGRVSSSEPLADNVILDLDEKAKIIGVEVLLPPTVKDSIRAQLPSQSKRRRTSR